MRIKHRNSHLGVKEAGDLIRVDPFKAERIVVKGPFNSYFLESYRGIVIKEKNVERFKYNNLYYFPRPVTVNDKEFPYPYKRKELWGYYIWGNPLIIKIERETLKRYNKLLGLLVPNPIMPNVVFSEIPPELPHSGVYDFQDDMEIVMTVYVTWRKKEGAPALPHELGHHIYFMLPPEIKDKAAKAWENLKRLGNIWMLAERHAIPNSESHWGHPWDSPTEMFASMLYVIERGTSPYRELAWEIGKEILGEKILKKVFRQTTHPSRRLLTY